MSSDEIVAIEGFEGLEGLVQGPEDVSGEQAGAVRGYAAVIKLPPHVSEAKLDHSAPSATLQLEHVYGYRCTDRNNIVVNSAGHLVYPASAVIVAMDPNTKQQVFGQGHTDDVEAFVQDPSNPDIIISGQKCSNTKSGTAGSRVAPYVCITNSRTGQVVRTIETNEDNGHIRAVSVSADGKVIAVGVVGTSSSHIYVFSATTGENLLGAGKSHRVQDNVFEIVFNPTNANNFTVGLNKTSLDGRTLDGSQLINFTLNGNALKATSTLVNATARFTALYAQPDNKIIVGGWGQLAIWVPGSTSLNQVKEWGTKAQRVNSIAKYADGKYLIGGESRNIAIVDGALNAVVVRDWPNGIRAITKDAEGNVYIGERKNTIVKLPASMFTAAPEESKSEPVVLSEGFMAGEAWPIAQHPVTPNVVVVAGEDGRMIVHDTEAFTSTVLNIGDPDAEDEPFPSKDGAFDPSPTIARLKTTKPAHMSRALDYSPDGAFLAVGTLGKAVYVYDVNGGYKLATAINAEAWSEAVRFSPDGKTLAIGNRKGKVKFIDTATFKERNSFTCGGAGIITLDWSTDSSFVRTMDTGAMPTIIDLSVDGKVKKGAEAQVMNSSIDWATHSIRHWWDTEGVWVGPHGRMIHKLTDINSISVNPSRTLIATGDDFGNVNLFRYPAVCPDWKKTSQFKAHRYHGHCEHVARVLFDNSGKRLYSTGGADLCTFQWKVVE